mmetsp:Transcript_6566/g.13538  ORF Transcript_6566/g.13538 Transcript_6566/m.13538 type:complete len:158 (-) Transcript_6566:288-761(-)
MQGKIPISGPFATRATFPEKRQRYLMMIGAHLTDVWYLCCRRWVIVGTCTYIAAAEAGDEGQGEKDRMTEEEHKASNMTNEMANSRHIICGGTCLNCGFYRIGWCVCHLFGYARVFALLPSNSRCNPPRHGICTACFLYPLLHTGSFHLFTFSPPAL